MEARAQACVARCGDRSGFVLPAVIITLVLLTVIAVGALSTGREEQLAARAMRESSSAFYAAEAGLHEIYADWDSLAAIDSLAPGDSLDLGWQTLADGSSYRAVVVRVDNGGQRMYGLRLEGRGPGAQSSQRALSFTMTAGSTPKLGRCCDATVTVDGTVAITDDTGIDGHDEHPPGWEAGGACEGPLVDKPGLIMRDTTQLDVQNPGYVDGEPPTMQDTTITDEAFESFGGLSWDSLKALADHVIDGSAQELVLDGEDVHPRHIGGECDTTSPYNWGSNDPADPCFGYFPIILVKGEVELHDEDNPIYGQGIVIIDWDDNAPVGEKGGEFELEEGTTFNGIILGKGCVEVQEGANFHGAIFTDGRYRNEETCGSDMDYEMNDNTGNGARATYSSCVVRRALESTALNEHTTSGATLLSARAFAELYE